MLFYFATKTFISKKNIDVLEHIWKLLCMHEHDLKAQPYENAILRVEKPTNMHTCDRQEVLRPRWWSCRVFVLRRVTPSVFGVRYRWYRSFICPYFVHCATAVAKTPFYAMRTLMRVASSRGLGILYVFETQNVRRLRSSRPFVTVRISLRTKKLGYVALFINQPEVLVVILKLGLIDRVQRFLFGV